MARTLRDRWVPRVLYMPVLACAMGMMMARLLILARLLAVPEFARLGVGLLVSNTFVMTGCLGLLQLLQREWPLNILRGREIRGMVLAAQSVLVALACATLALAALACGVPAGGAGMVAGIGVLHGCAQLAFLVATVESRSRGDAMRYARQNMLRSSLAMAVGVGAALLGASAVWVLLAEALAAVLQSWITLARSAARIAMGLSALFALALRRLRTIDWRAAMTMLLGTSLTFLAMNADRWLAADRLDGHEFALYSFAWILLLISQSLQSLINASFYPLLVRTYGSRGRREVFSLCLKSSACMLAAGLVLALPLWWLMDRAVEWWFPAYRAAAGLFPIFLLIAVLRVSNFWSSYLLVVGREAAMLAANVVAAGIGICLWLLLVRPWADTLQMPQLALLGAILAVLAYGVLAGVAWRGGAD